MATSSTSHCPGMLPFLKVWWKGQACTATTPTIRVTAQSLPDTNTDTCPHSPEPLQRSLWVFTHPGLLITLCPFLPHLLAGSDLPRSHPSPQYSCIHPQHCMRPALAGTYFHGSTKSPHTQDAQTSLKPAPSLSKFRSHASKGLQTAGSQSGIPRAAAAA